MFHLGDITLIDGNTVPPVDVVIGGSPCQDLSIAGRREGLSGERSGLFMEQLRVIREMREADVHRGKTGQFIRPRYMVWENVPGAFSSNKGEDFRIVLEETARIADKTAVIPRPPKGKWRTSGCIMGDGWSIAWRVLDAQFWGVPQRRRRIALVADFGGASAPEILFVRKSMCGNFAEGSETGEDVAEGTGSGVDTAISINDKATRYRGGGKSRNADGAGNGMGIGRYGDPCFTLTAADRHAVYDARGNGDGKTVSTLTGDHQNRVTDYTCICVETGQASDDVAPLVLREGSYGTYGDGFGTLKASGGALGGGSESLVAYTNKTVRRLTPLECERLQGYPSERKWDVSKMTKDEYIAWNLAKKHIIVDAEAGKVYGTRGPGGIPYKEPKELKGTEVNGYKVISIRNGGTKLQCRVNRVVWIAKNGIIPEGYCVDHINNDKKDNRIENLQLLTPEENSHKAKEDGLYAVGMYNKATKLDPDIKDEICYLYQWSALTQRNLAEIYGVSKSRINQIVKEVGWTDIEDWIDSKGKIRKCSDAARYKALGNSIALPPWKWVLKRISAQYERDATMASLFDGIGGFQLLWERINGKGTCLWVSEIEEFPMAVTRARFG